MSQLATSNRRLALVLAAVIGERRATFAADTPTPVDLDEACAFWRATTGEYAGLIDAKVTTSKVPKIG